MVEIMDKKCIGFEITLEVPLTSFADLKSKIDKHLKEFNFKEITHKKRDERGDLRKGIALTKTFTPEEAEEVFDYLRGFIEEILIEIYPHGMDDESMNEWNTFTWYLVLGKEIKMKNLDFNKDTLYFLMERAKGLFRVIIPINDMLDLDKKHSKLCNKLFEISPNRLYEENINKAGRRFIMQKTLKRALAFIERLEKYSKINKIPYQIKKIGYK